MRFAFIGAGKVGVTLGKYLAESESCTLAGYYSKSRESATKAASYTKSECFEDMSTLISNSDAIFLTVPDAMIASVYAEICHYDLSGKHIIHCSGSLSSNLFSGLSQVGAQGLSIHPLYAFSQPYGDNKRLSEAVFSVEGSQQAVAFWQEILKAKGNTVVLLSTEQKNKYHCAAVLGSNLMLGLLATSISLLKECGFSTQEALQALHPLTIGNLEKAFLTTPVAALTGPLERADMQTVKKHLNEMDEETSEIYKCLSKRVVKLAKEKNPDRDYQEIEEILQ